MILGVWIRELIESLIVLNTEMDSVGLDGSFDEGSGTMAYDLE